ncbi:protease modulator HflC [Methylococcus capsulatus]|uniref:Protein HflC n=1 Tax=Methylococcus capsulatus (strain ATCC 33009 / NCIMB 11132 / Bath) TaxID=243233 RepID=Q60BZ8_METCA|nr:protease modulator HflC [Methylococcus capsulatus]AAU90433.1 putative hflC protein [Methylococcus capsulatus str. Bath]QXP88853.1 protease modulator HflC [Methylococcus capsulatus]QXP94113.1 protease modulator HflC [Methylococcus capsulatus]UQN11146.1 protease modulator HflC [Methylococcus capsulatus]
MIAARHRVSLVAALVLLALYLSAYTVDQTEQVIVTQFGRPVGEPITEPGLHFKLPFVQQVNRFDKRYLAWDGPMVEMSTKDKTYLQVDTFARWRITDAMRYYLRLRDERSAQSRLEDILGSETRTAIARHELIEVVRSDKERQPLRDEGLAAQLPEGGLRPIRVGRQQIEKDVFESAAPKLAEFGIELLDVRFKRLNYNPEVLERIHQRMISERLQIAQRFRSEGEGEAARIAGNKERDINEIASTAYKRVQEIVGEADARATEIYAKAYTQSPEAAEFYRFLKSMETYRRIIDRDATLVLSTRSDLFSLLKRIETERKP